MKTLQSLFLLIFLISYGLSSESENNAENEEFIPSREWQVIKKGQKIPKGLHIRVNLAEGYTEAKLLDLEEFADSNDESQALIETEDTQTRVEINPITLKLIKDKPAKTFDNRISDLIQEYVAAKAEGPKINDNKLLAVLENLEDLVHDVDYGLDFIRYEGLENVIIPNLNSTNKALTAQSLLVLGSCMQNNEAVKLYAFEIGLLQKIHYIFARNNDVTLSIRALFALGSMLRTTPIIQGKFVALGGITSCLNALESKNIRLKVKTVTLLNDLMLEKKMMEILSKDGGKNQADSENYDVNIQEHLLEQNYCMLLANLLVEVTSVDQNDFATIEFVLFALANVKESCAKQYNDKEKQFLVKIAHDYGDLQFPDDGNKIATTLTVVEIIREFENQEEELRKDEL